MSPWNSPHFNTPLKSCQGSILRLVGDYVAQWGSQYTTRFHGARTYTLRVKNGSLDISPLNSTCAFFRRTSLGDLPTMFDYPTKVPLDSILYSYIHHCRSNSHDLTFFVGLFNTSIFFSDGFPKPAFHGAAASFTEVAQQAGRGWGVDARGKAHAGLRDRWGRASAARGVEDWENGSWRGQEAFVWKWSFRVR